VHVDARVTGSRSGGADPFVDAMRLARCPGWVELRRGEASRAEMARRQWFFEKRPPDVGVPPSRPRHGQNTID